MIKDEALGARHWAFGKEKKKQTLGGKDNDSVLAVKALLMEADRVCSCCVVEFS